MSINQTVKKRVIFCDFDGTITVNDNIIALIKQFNPPGWEDIASRTIATELSIKEGVGQMFRLLPSSMKDEMIQYSISNARIRDGFQTFLDYCNSNDIQVLVTSGGIDFFVFPLLEPFGIPKEHIFCNGSDFSSAQTEILWPHPCDEHCANDCGMCKTTIMRRYPASRYERIIIGDSVTDFEGAKQADVVFSRSHLTEKCRELGIPHNEYESFHDIIHVLDAQRSNVT